jgi:hypothetical protein
MLSVDEVHHFFTSYSTLNSESGQGSHRVLEGLPQNGRQRVGRTRCHNLQHCGQSSRRRARFFIHQRT